MNDVSSDGSEVINISIKRLDKDLPLPHYAYVGDAGLDLMSSIDQDIPAGERRIIPTGIALSLPQGYAGFVQPRSGLALRAGISIVNTPGLIDSAYRGEIKVIMINTDLHQSFHVAKGDRIAQLVIQRVPIVTITEVDELDVTDRGERGFGSSGIANNN